MLLRDPQSFAEPLEMHYFPHSEEPERIRHIRILHDTEQVVVGCAGFLLCCQILEQIRNRVSLGLELTGIKGDTAGGLRPDAGSMVDIVRSKARRLDFFRS